MLRETGLCLSNAFIIIIKMLFCLDVEQLQNADENALEGVTVDMVKSYAQRAKLRDQPSTSAPPLPGDTDLERATKNGKTCQTRNSIR